jgi:hypothetical protein
MKFRARATVTTGTGMIVHVSTKQRIQESARERLNKLPLTKPATLEVRA